LWQPAKKLKAESRAFCYWRFEVGGKKNGKLKLRELKAESSRLKVEKEFQDLVLTSATAYS